jgi:hypothetical protein
MGFVKAAKNGHIRFKRKTKEENVQVKKNILCKKFGNNNNISLCCNKCGTKLLNPSSNKSSTIHVKR